MILVADSGSTKTNWIAINEKGETYFKIDTDGLNPAVFSKKTLYDPQRGNTERTPLAPKAGGLGKGLKRAVYLVWFLARPHLQHRVPQGALIRVVVWDPDGRRRILTEFGQRLEFSNFYPTAESDYLGGRIPEGRAR